MESSCLGETDALNDTHVIRNLNQNCHGNVSMDKKNVPTGIGGESGRALSLAMVKGTKEQILRSSNGEMNTSHPVMLGG
jgi:hypothetical protein